MKILLTGSSGLIGSALKERLEQDGHEVGCLKRIKTENEPFWDINEGRIDFADFSEPEVVIHLAGENVATGSWSHKKKVLIRSSRVKGTALLAKTLAKLPKPPRIFLCGSAIGIYGNCGNEVLDEESPYGEGFLAEVGREWEAEASPAIEAGIRTLFLRTGIVLASEGGALAKMIPPFRLGLGGKVGDGKQYFSWISLEDEIRAIQFLLNHETLEGAVNLTAPKPVTNTELTQALGRVLNRLTVLPFPAFAAKALLGEMAEELLLASTRVIPKKLMDAGYTFYHSDVELALREVLNKVVT